jgi:hypothetical protein
MLFENIINSNIISETNIWLILIRLLFHVDTSKIIFLFYCFYIYLHVYTLFGPSPPPAASRQNLFHPLILQFCWRDNLRDNKKNIAILLVWDKSLLAIHQMRDW